MNERVRAAGQPPVGSYRNIPYFALRGIFHEHGYHDREVAEAVGISEGAFSMKNKISVGTIARTAVLLLALTNQVLSALGKPILPIDSEQLEQLITAGFTTVSAIINWWYNQSFTQAAIEADKTYDKLTKSFH